MVLKREKALKLNNLILIDIFRRNQNVFMADKWDKDWAEAIPDLKYTMNATFQKTLERSPADEIFGRKICRERWYCNK